MKNFKCFALAAALAAVASADAAEWRYDVNMGMATAFCSFWGYFLEEGVAQPAPDSTAPPGVTITIPDSGPGADSVYWVNRNLGYAGRSPKSGTVGWLKAIVDEASNMGVVRDTQSVLVGGSVRAYVRTHTVSAGFHTEKTILAGVGVVYFHESYSSMYANCKSYYRNLRLLEYNGMNIDSLWGSVLTGPVAVAPAARRHVAPRAASRRFDLHEMGLFLGRKALLDRDKPLPTGAK